MPRKRATRGCGVATLLLAVMWVTAYCAVVDRLIGYVQIENRQAACWMRACGATGEWDGFKLIYHWDLAALDHLPETRVAAELADWLARLSSELLG
ncbi:MAG: hypothetical protein WED15_10045 [Akkermansiaceae bacterium]